ncbi:MAG: hypothetical protein WCK67_00155 [bacterium]
MSENLDNIQVWEELARHPRLGEILLQRKNITISQLGEALEIQRTQGLPIGEALISLNFITKEELMQQLELQSSIGKILTESFDEIKKLKDNDNQ